MCRSIKKLNDRNHNASDAEITDAALQYIRKISGYRIPSKANEEVFNNSVAEVAKVTKRLLENL